MTLFERKAIDWLKSLDNVHNKTEESYYANILLKILAELDGQSVKDLLRHIDNLENRVEYLERILDNYGVNFYRT